MARCAHCAGNVLIRNAHVLARSDSGRFARMHLDIYGDNRRVVCNECLNTYYTAEPDGLFTCRLDTRLRDDSYGRNPDSDEELEEVEEEETETAVHDSAVHVQPVLSYNADPFNYFDWDPRNKKNALVFGVELEMAPAYSTRDLADREAAAPLIRALRGPVGANYILKHDGSLPCGGVELVTMPFTLSQHIQNTGIAWGEILKAVNERSLAKSGAGTDTCGMHVHINKKALSALTIGKMLVFLNNSDIAPLITIVAQRHNSAYARLSTKKLTDGTVSSENRYDIMNVSVRHPTCEIRMFRGNLTPERIYKNIEFCHALVQYCRQSSMRTLCEWDIFVAWLRSVRGQYPNLVRFLIDQKTIGFRDLIQESYHSLLQLKDR